MFTTHFYGQPISEYGLKNNRVDYHALAAAMDAVMCNSIIERFSNAELENGDFEYYEYDGERYTYSELQELLDEAEELENEAEAEETIARIQEALDNPYYDEVFQYFIISDNGAEILKRETHELVWYIPELDVYVWGITHYGTSWDYVLTEIECNPESTEE